MDDVAVRLAHLELELRRTDPDLIAAFERVPRGWVVRSRLTWVLVVGSCLGLAAGLALGSLGLWVLGLGAFLAAFAADPTAVSRG